jgi:hypothetical protein
VAGESRYAAARGALFGEGATIVFGHDWLEDGVMEAIYGYARLVQPPATDREVVWQAFVKVGREGISRANKSTAEENEELFHAAVLDRVIKLVLVGLSRLRPDLPRRPIGGA